MQTTVACCVFNDYEDSLPMQFDGWFEGLKHGDHTIQGHGEKSYCSNYLISDADLPENHDMIDKLVPQDDSTIRINDLDPEPSSITDAKLEKFLEYFDETMMTPGAKGPDYLIIDNFAEFFKLEVADLKGARSEAEVVAKAGCAEVKGGRCDALVWLRDLSASDDNPSLQKLSQAMKGFTRSLKMLSLKEEYDKSLRVDKEEM